MKTIDKENYEVMQNNPYAEDLTIALYEFFRYEYENNIFNKNDKRKVEKAVKNVCNKYLEIAEREFF